MVAGLYLPASMPGLLFPYHRPTVVIEGTRVGTARKAATSAGSSRALPAPKN